MIYMWELPETLQNKFIAVYDDKLSPDRFLFMHGHKLSPNEVSKIPIFDVKVSQAQIQKYDCIPDNVGVPIVNQKIIDILRKLAPNDVEFFDVKIKCKDANLSGYSLLNVKSRIKGIDFEKSEYKKIPMPGDTFIYIFKYMTYKPGCMEDHKLARDEEYLDNLLVTEEIKQTFAKEKIRGMRFVRPEDFYRPLTAQDVIDYDSTD